MTCMQRPPRIGGAWSSISRGQPARLPDRAPPGNGLMVIGVIIALDMGARLNERRANHQAPYFSSTY